MVVRTKGDALEIAPGVEFIEREHTTGPAVHAVVLSDVEVITHNDGMRQFSWTAKVLPTGYETYYLVTEGCEAYGPALYSIGSEEYRMRFLEEALPFNEASNIKLM